MKTKTEQTLVEAVEFIVREALRERPTKTAYTKVVKALYRIGLDSYEVGRILYIMDYADSKGEPYQWIFKKKQ